jgi:hypothetical protein
LDVTLRGLAKFLFGRAGFILLLFGFIVVSPGLLLGLMLIAGSERTIYQRVKSPDGWSQARVQFDDAGAISSFERVVFVKHAWNPSDAPLLSCRAFWGHGQAKVELRWTDSSTLVVRHHVAPKNIADVSRHCGATRIVTEPVLPYEDS